MQRIPRFFLWMLSLLVPVFIAACYGPPQRYRSGGGVDHHGPRPDLQGRVVEAGTQQALANIDVFCIDRSQQVLFRAATDTAGHYRIPGHIACTNLQFGDGQHARYKPLSIPVVTLDPDTAQVSLDPAD